jgi:hypothetical protein
MSVDFARIVKRKDVDYHFAKNVGNDEMIFYSESTGYPPDGITTDQPQSTVSLVGYRVKDSALDRLGKSLVWNGVTGASPGVGSLDSGDNPMVFLPQKIATTWPEAINGGDDTDFQKIAPGVFRMEFSYLLKSGTGTGLLSNDPSVATTNSDVRVSESASMRRHRSLASSSLSLRR